MDTKPARVATISGPDEVDKAVATLVLAFGIDPSSALDLSRRAPILTSHASTVPSSWSELV